MLPIHPWFVALNIENDCLNGNLNNFYKKKKQLTKNSPDVWNEVDNWISFIPPDPVHQNHPVSHIGLNDLRDQPDECDAQQTAPEEFLLCLLSHLYSPEKGLTQKLLS